MATRATVFEKDNYGSAAGVWYVTANEKSSIAGTYMITFIFNSDKGEFEIYSNTNTVRLGWINQALKEVNAFQLNGREMIDVVEAFEAALNRIMAASY